MAEEMMKCPKCGKSLPEHALADHFRVEHKDPPRSGTLAATQAVQAARRSHTEQTLAGEQAPMPQLDAVCPVCGVTLRAANLDKHMRKCRRPPAPTDVVKSAPKAISAGSLIRSIDELDDAFLEGDLETVTDEFYDQMYGDKYAGQSWPESSGQYGSIPLYDDYSDEGEA